MEHPGAAVKRKETIAVSGLWTRRIGDRYEVLLELSDGWHVIESLDIDSITDNQPSHIMEVSFIEQSPKDEL